jgi:hypothetical protein
MIDTTMLKSIAVQIPANSKPGTNAEVRITMKALMKNVNSPKVTILIGRVRSINIGFINKLRVPSTTATIIAVTKSST